MVERVERVVNNDGFTEYHEGKYWFEVFGGDHDEVIMYHECPKGKECNVLFMDEVQRRECTRCGPVEFPDDLWVLYVLMDGRGVNNVE
jgi:hypothetical protein